MGSHAIRAPKVARGKLGCKRAKVSDGVVDLAGKNHCIDEELIA